MPGGERVELGTGSSPLTRGKPPRTIRLYTCHRLIPAHAGKTQRPPRGPGNIPAHPRSRGENHGLGIVPVIPSGSSPLTRGKLGKSEPRDPLSRLIPAHAGKTFERPVRS